MAMKQQRRNGMNRKSSFDIGARVSAWRKERRLLQKELAAKADMNATQLWALEHGRSSPSMRSVERIADALGITIVDLMSPPGEDASGDAGSDPADPSRALLLPEAGFLPTVSSYEDIKPVDAATLHRLCTLTRKARATESLQSSLAPTDLPLFSQVSESEAGAEQLAYALRAHLDVGSAIIHDTIPLFESHGVRVIDTKMPDKPGSVSLYDPRSNNFTVFIASQFKDKPWRRDFLLLTEIGRAFLFFRRGRMPYHETKRSRRFAHHFAATFLQPEAAVRYAVSSLNVKPDEWTYELLLRMKERFGVSAQFFNIRLKELSLITRRRHAEFDAKIKRHYKRTGYSEPMASNRKPGRRHDLAAMAT